jgi:hypothetical protein
MNEELGNLWKETIVVYYRLISRHSPGGCEESHDKSQSERLVSRLVFVPDAFRIQFKIFTDRTRFFCTCSLLRDNEIGDKLG